MYRASFKTNHIRVLTHPSKCGLNNLHEEVYAYEKSLLKQNYIYNAELEEISYIEKTSGDKAHIDNIEKNLLKEQIGFLIQECAENYVIIDLFNANNYNVKVGDKDITNMRNIKVFVKEHLVIEIDNISNPSKRLMLCPTYINEIELVYA